MGSLMKKVCAAAGSAVVALSLAGFLVWLVSVPFMEPLVGDNTSLISPAQSEGTYEWPSNSKAATTLGTDKPGTVRVTDVNTGAQHTYVPHDPCSFGYAFVNKPHTRGCVTRGKFAVSTAGVWGVACRLGNCRKFGDLCIFLPRPSGWGDTLLLPGEIKDYRKLPKGAKAGAC